MSVSPGTYNFTLQRRASYSLALQLKDGNNAAIDLTGATVAAQVWDESRSTKYADFAIAYTSRVNGQFTASLTDVQTAGLPDTGTSQGSVRLHYDVLVTSAGGLKGYYLEGQITVSEGYTT